MCRCPRHQCNSSHWRATHYRFAHNGTTHLLRWPLDPVRRHRVERYHLLRVWLHLPGPQLTLFAVHARHSSDNGGNNDDASSGGDDHKHRAEARGVQALLRTELGQLVLQVHVGLLRRVPVMCNNDHRQQYYSNCYNNDNALLDNTDRHNHDATAAYLQASLLKQHKALD